MAVDLSVEIAGVRFSNPIWVASSELTGSLTNAYKAITSGAGGVVLKSVADNPKYNDPRLTKWRILDEKHEWCRGKVPRLFTMYSRGGPAQHPDIFLRDIEQKKEWAEQNGVVLIGSVAETTADNWVRAAELISSRGLRLIELNFGSPHSGVSDKTSGMELGQDADIVADITSKVARAVPVPLIVKLTQQVADVGQTARAARDAGAVAITVSNRHQGFLVDLETGNPYIHGSAGVGGPWIKPLTMLWVSRLFAQLGIPVTASGGAYDWRDAAEFLFAGATSVQYCSSVMVRGYGIIRQVVGGLERYLEAKGYSSVREIIGHATKAAVSYKEVLDLPLERAVLVDAKSCVDCGKCVRQCLFGAMAEAEKAVSVGEACVGCGLCVAICPVPGTLALVER